MSPSPRHTRPRQNARSRCGWPPLRCPMRSSRCAQLPGCCCLQAGLRSSETVHVYVCHLVCMYVCIYIYIVCVCSMFARRRLCVRRRLYIYIYIYIYTHTYTYIHIECCVYARAYYIHQNISRNYVSICIHAWIYAYLYSGMCIYCPRTHAHICGQ